MTTTYTQLYATCRRCYGTGVNPEDPENPDPQVCGCCGGSGKVSTGFVSLDDVLAKCNEILAYCEKILDNLPGGGHGEAASLVDAAADSGVADATIEAASVSKRSTKTRR